MAAHQRDAGAVHPLHLPVVVPVVGEGVRRASTAGTSSFPVTASAAPATRCAARRALAADRSSALDGMQAQYEHSPPTSSGSISAAVSPPRTARSAAFSPTGPAPSTITSYSVVSMPPAYHPLPLPIGNFRLPTRI